jgi:signal transduction histidine kinase
MGLTQLSNSILETLLFMAISICLSRLKNRDLCYLAAGLLLLITFNLAHRLTYMLHFQYRLFDMAWLLSYIVIIYGFYRSWKNQKPIQFFEENSIHVLTGAIFLAFTGFLFIVFTALEVFIAFLQGRTFIQAFAAFDNMASVLVFTFMFSVLTGKIAAHYLSAPVDKIMKRIQRAQKYPEEFSNSPPPDFMALEVKALDAFITKTIGDLQVANQVKANFLMNMSHDFSTPASGIYMLATSVYNRLEDGKLKRYQSMVVESSRQFLVLLEDVLDFSRFSNQKINPKYSNIKINELINDIIALMTPKIEEKGLTISSEMEKLDFSSDPVLLQRILINLVSNAVKFTEKGFVFIKVESVIEGA